MIDLHSHLLPNVDDGSSSLAETSEMLRLWAEFEFDTVVATHHLSGDMRPEYRRRIEEAVDEAASTIDESPLDVRIGFEIMLDPGLPGRLEQTEGLTLGPSRAVLVEVPFLNWPSYTESVLFDLQLSGYQPVLAHPERYEDVQRNLELAIAVAERGVVLQLTYASLAGTLGAAPRRVAEQLIVRDLRMILASDAHGPGQRLQAIPEGMRRAEELVGAERLRQMTTDIPAALLADKALPEPAAVPARPSRQERLGRFLRGT